MKFAKLYSDAIIPTRKNITDAGVDLYAYTLNEYGEGVIAIPSNNFCIIHTGIVAKIPTMHFGWITNKSRNNYIIGGGIVDEGYQGELLVKVINPNNYTEFIYHGTAIAQLLIIPCRILGIEEVPLDTIFFLSRTSRGTDGGIARQVEPDRVIELGVGSYDYIADDIAYDAARERMDAFREY